MLPLAVVVAANRFGLGCRPEEAARVGADPRGWLKAQLDNAGETPRELAGLPGGEAQTALFLETRRRRGDEGVQKLFREGWREVFAEEAGARVQAAIASPVPFRERLVHFWSNHFTVSALRPVVAGLAGAFEREAIRPHLLGRFEDMLIAVARHPAMLFYLDNAVSIGPDSLAGRFSGRGLNENLAREILELHTLGVEGGYGQADVTALAALLTGWSVAQPERDSRPGSFRFNYRAHQPGEKVLLGRRFGEGGMSEGEAALRFLARHPATARHLATKLARHFVADEPPAAAVDRLANVYLESGGDLRAMTLAVVDLPEAWAAANSKVRSPQDFLVAALRAVAVVPERKALIGSLRELGQVPYAARSPAGWPDVAAAWVGPEAMLRRIEWARVLAERLAAPRRPDEVADHALGEAAGAATRRAIAAAPDAREGMALLFASPQFQRR